MSMTKEIRSKLIDLEAQILTLWYEVDDCIKEERTPNSELINTLKMLSRLLKTMKDGK